MDSNNYDIIICGGGVSGLILAEQLCKDAYFKNHKILLIEKEKTKNKEVKTWSFWENQNAIYPHLITKSWKYGIFASSKHNKTMCLNPYEYKTIHSRDFYSYMYTFLESKSNQITIKYEKIIKIESTDKNVIVSSEKKKYKGIKVFSSVLGDSFFQKQKKYPALKQHFIGWVIKTNDTKFSENCMTMMDFSVPQQNNTRFMYVLPYNKKEALVEYTLFSPTLLKKEIYENNIKSYIKSKLGVSNYEIVQKEEGDIPMTCFPFYKKNTHNLIYIGSVGGWTKPSTGYTFKKSYDSIKKIIYCLKEKKSLLKLFNKRNKFWYYDLLLLDVLSKNNDYGYYIFEKLFLKNKPALLLKFLDEKTTFLEDLKIILSLPKVKFITAFFKRIF